MRACTAASPWVLCIDCTKLVLSVMKLRFGDVGMPEETRRREAWCRIEATVNLLLLHHRRAAQRHSV